MKKEVVFLGGARTPMGEYGGVLKDMTANELGAAAAAEAMRRWAFGPTRSTTR
jgi:acetyl-CoA acetyltransferase